MSAAYGAAAPYASPLLYVQKRVASVSVPVGRRTSVAVNSVTDERKTIETAAARPGAIRGSVTRLKTASGGCPSERAASSSLGEAWAMLGRIAISASGKPSTA